VSTRTGRTPRTPRTRAPELVGRRWVGTDGRALRLADLRGRFVLLDFWTSCCVNCLHVLDELRELEERWAAELVVVGVHSPKFPHEAEPDVLDDAVRRYEVHHPVLDDADMTTWRAFAARAWPTLVLVDPTGYAVASLSGEGHADGLDRLLAELVAEHDERGTLVRGERLFAPLVEEPAPGGLRFPSSAVVLPERLGGGVLVTDTGHHRLAVLDDDLRVAATIGEGVRGLADGDAASARFAEPQGLCLLPEDVAARLGVDVVVADSANHAVRGVRLSRSGSGDDVVTLAGTGRQLRRREGGGPALAQDLSTPWDVAWWDDQLVVAMAGLHQLWALQPAPAGGGPRDGVVRVVAGTSAEGLRDGDAEQAWFAQTSRLVPSADGQVLWVVDSETSALRRLVRAPGADGDRSVPVVQDARLANAAPVAAPGYRVETVVGSGLFDFGDRDGEAGAALLQHPLGAAVLPDGSVAVADTYNGALRRYEPAATGGVPAVTTLAADLAEPTGVVVAGAGKDAELLVVESRAHRVLRLPLTAGRAVGTEEGRVERPPSPLAPGEVGLRVRFAPPSGQHLDDRYGSPVRVVVSATPPDLLVEGEGAGQQLERRLVLRGEPGARGVLHVSAQAAACDAGEDGEVPEHAACHLYQQDWGIPVVLDGEAPAELVLDLRGV